MMITVVGIYACCWLPLHVITIAEDVNPNLYDAEYMQMVWTAAHWLAMSSCVYNPIIYGWMNSKFREGFKNIILALRGQASIRRKPSWILPERKPLNHCDHGSKETFGSNQKAINLVLCDISENRQGKDTESIPLSVYTRNISSESLQKPEIV
ncbi:hypothetical protein SNE40_018790 [Patella caerulea]|uniref:G-protein coupled receptors family 1 profile domain-containing protein n=1 Tax=Patella caerulea TaxID=87958 RepID=A0AAN8PD75_PATCE